MKKIILVIFIALAFQSISYADSPKPSPSPVTVANMSLRDLMGVIAPYPAPVWYRAKMAGKTEEEIEGTWVWYFVDFVLAKR